MTRAALESSVKLLDWSVPIEKVPLSTIVGTYNSFSTLRVMKLHIVKLTPLHRAALRYAALRCAALRRSALRCAAQGAATWKFPVASDRHSSYLRCAAPICAALRRAALREQEVSQYETF